MSSLGVRWVSACREWLEKVVASGFEQMKTVVEVSGGSEDSVMEPLGRMDRAF